MRKLLIGVTAIIIGAYGIPKHISKEGETHVIPSTNTLDWGWTGSGEYRIKVSVASRDIGDRRYDEAPVKITLDLNQIPAGIRTGNYIDPGSIEVIAYDHEGQPIIQKSSRNGSIYQLPHRWDDFDHRSKEFFYHPRGNGQQGDLVWRHTQYQNKGSYYAVYFRTTDSIDEGGLGSMNLVGDGDPIYGSDEPVYGGLHLKIEVVDWDNDGLFDFLLGDTPGYLQWYRNEGTATKPKFRSSKFLEVDGEIFKHKYAPAFCAVDWDDDGDIDLIYGKEPLGEVFYLENIGTRSNPRLTSRGQMMCEGKPLKLPGKPFADKPDISDAWGGREYMSTPDVVDWDGDGDKDLMLGSYTGGQVYFFENIRNSKGIPELTWRGFLNDSEGNMIDSDFGASPDFVDLDADGDLDLVLGGADWTENAGGQPKEISTNLLYYENIGTPTRPSLKQRPFPDELQGKGLETVVVPSLADLDADGDLDLMVSTVMNISIYLNEGTIHKPWFRSQGLLTTPWNPVIFGGFASTPFDIDGNGYLDIIASYSSKFRIMRNLDGLNPPVFQKDGFLKFGGQEFKYVFPHGDPELFSSAADLDQDGLTDFLWGNGEGNVWFARNQGMQGGEFQFAAQELLVLKSGEPVKVGHFDPNGEISDFKTHSGDRSDPEPADFDGDGDLDLMVADNYGGITYFENVSGNSNPVFAKGEVVKEEDGRRLLHEVVDWNEDGKPDILYCRSNQVVLWLNTGAPGTPKFNVHGNLLEGRSIPYAHAYAVDWTGDGDTDLLIASSYLLLYVFERSYLDNGILQGSILEVEKRSK